ncbi:transcriptional repressor [Sphingobacterium sp. lm-10]|uniref:transcriptional repressor n=1 Tax=Sphingobacterium sp. lm-10 TaxID=2944904 RepID=UPI00202074EE|nr:transcriptional repressor [Sphingobacterium sp. lm-10]MCL7988191.1 transcriptional repressor [Sphingobacterium sp. lm-10]
MKIIETDLQQENVRESSQETLTTQVYQTLVNDHFIVNKQRKIVIEELLSHSERTTAEQLWLKISKTKKISISTVYNTLNILCRNGVAYKFYDEINQAFYSIDQTFFL